jgi:glycerol-3-phosphate O-acyltransferase
LQPSYAAALDQIKAKLTATIPEKYAGTMLPLLEHFGQEYLTAHQAAFEAGNTLGTDPASSAQRFLTGISYGLRYGMPQSPEHYTFDVTHSARRGTSPDDAQYGNVDFYKFGCDFFSSCMDLTSPEINVLGRDNLQQALAQVAAGENVVFLANHQSEADPQVVSACLSLAGHEQAAADMTYVAGHKVTTDPLAIPFSMGRNLICIHSKKHIDADPETKPVKQKQNLKAMNALLQQFKDGGALVWVAPSGGRDRRNVETDTVPIAPFDRKTIDMFRLLGNKSKVPTHFYSMAMVSYQLCPPPDFVEAGTGETRNVRFVPVGIAVGDEVLSVGGLESRDTFSETAQHQCQADYERLLAALQK